MNTREALIALNLTMEVGGARLKKLIDHFGSPEAAIGRDCRELEDAGLAPGLARKVAGISDGHLARELAEARRRGVGILTTADSGYPLNLRNMFDPPPVLYCRGELRPEDSLAVAIVGSRRASAYGLSLAKDFARGLAGYRCAVVSGMARGVDTQAHRGALAAGGRTVAVMGSGFNRIYPPENRGLADDISRQGCVVSEFPMDAAPLKQNFPRRNRVISGLSLGVLVVEACRNSGALITADFALEQGREVFAVPGSVNSPASEGTNRLIRGGAVLASRVEDIIEEFPFIGAFSGGEEPAGGNGKKPVGREEELLYGIISGKEPSLDELARESGMSVCRLSGLLLKMQLSRMIKRIPGNRFSRG